MRIVRHGEGVRVFLIQIGICTHLGCVPLGQQGRLWWLVLSLPRFTPMIPRGASVSGPAPENLHVPKYEFISDTQVRIG